MALALLWHHFYQVHPKWTKSWFKNRESRLTKSAVATANAVVKPEQNQHKISWTSTKILLFILLSWERSHTLQATKGSYATYCTATLSRNPVGSGWSRRTPGSHQPRSSRNASRTLKIAQEHMSQTWALFFEELIDIANGRSRKVQRKLKTCVADPREGARATYHFAFATGTTIAPRRALGGEKSVLKIMSLVSIHCKVNSVVALGFVETRGLLRLRHNTPRRRGNDHYLYKLKTIWAWSELLSNKQRRYLILFLPRIGVISDPGSTVFEVSDHSLSSTSLCQLNMKVINSRRVKSQGPWILVLIKSVFITVESSQSTKQWLKYINLRW